MTVFEYVLTEFEYVLTEFQYVLSVYEYVLSEFEVFFLVRFNVFRLFLSMFGVSLSAF